MCYLRLDTLLYVVVWANQKGQKTVLKQILQHFIVYNTVNFSDPSIQKQLISVFRMLVRIIEKEMEALEDDENA